MGSENNMVAVPERDPLIRAVASLRAAISLLRNGGEQAAPSARMFNQMLADYEQAADNAAARLASAQPDAQQGEVTLYREIDALGGAGDGDWHKGYSEALTDVLAILSKRGFTEFTATPPSPALDAATIERCAQVAEQRAPAVQCMSVADEVQACLDIAAAIRALPNAEKRHG